MRLWNVYGEIVLTGVKAETREAAIEAARAICSDDPVQAASFFNAIETKAEGA